ncbi:MAG: ABC transporter ATP-binding protein [Bacteroidetes bacterium]|nr:ABC transporter ATP-binding protein [Bacteroidota bacterium]
MNELLSVSDLELSFRKGKKYFTAIEQISFSIKRGETVGLVGESGCGKSVTAYTLMNMLPPKSSMTGNILFTDKNNKKYQISELNPAGKEMQSIRTGEIGMIYQEPMSSLNPVHTINHQISEAILAHNDITKKEASDKVVELLRYVGIKDAEKRSRQYPHQFSGGMRQRAMIAMALSCDPSLLIADEPTTALDVTIEAQILSLIRAIQQERNMAMLLISHDLGVIGQMSDRIMVMYAGHIVEESTSQELFEDPLHPYTKDLIHARPALGSKEKLYEIPGTVPSIGERGKGCLFAGRCSKAMDICFEKNPPNFYRGERGVKCWLYE